MYFSQLLSIENSTYTLNCNQSKIEAENSFQRHFFLNNESWKQNFYWRMTLFGIRYIRFAMNQWITCRENTHINFDPCGRCLVARLRWTTNHRHIFHIHIYKTKFTCFSMGCRHIALNGSRLTDRFHCICLRMWRKMFYEIKISMVIFSNYWENEKIHVQYLF